MKKWMFLDGKGKQTMTVTSGNPAAPGAAPLKLNLGCGSNKLEGFVNVDKFGSPDVTHDLETFPWPWRDSSVEEVTLVHVLEHLGRVPDVFIGIMKEIYRVCRNGAHVYIVVPHPRHDDFLGDPTHVRPVTAQMMALFDRALCEEWQRQGASNTPLALYHNVDFHIVKHELVPEEQYRKMLQENRMTFPELEALSRSNNNVVTEIHLDLEVRK
jgi:predicted SAM-dependent methyltransferase